MVFIGDIWSPDVNRTRDVTSEVFQFLTDIDDSDIGILLIYKGLQLFRLNENLWTSISTIRNGLHGLRDGEDQTQD